MITRKYLWFDLETDNAELPTHENRIFEVAAIVTDENFEQKSSFSAVVGGAHGRRYDLTTLSPFIRDMHDKSGLLAEIPYGRDLQAVESGLKDFVRKHFSDEQISKRQIVMAGHSIAFDKQMVKCHMSSFDEMLSYRLRDGGDIGRFLRDEVKMKLPRADTRGHRALADASGALQEHKTAFELCKRANWALNQMVEEVKERA